MSYYKPTEAFNCTVIAKGEDGECSKFKRKISFIKDHSLKDAEVESSLKKEDDDGFTIVRHKNSNAGMIWMYRKYRSTIRLHHDKLDEKSDNRWRLYFGAKTSTLNVSGNTVNININGEEVMAFSNISDAVDKTAMKSDGGDGIMIRARNAHQIENFLDKVDIYLILESKQELGRIYENIKTVHN